MGYTSTARFARPPHPPLFQLWPHDGLKLLAETTFELFLPPASAPRSRKGPWVARGKAGAPPLRLPLFGFSPCAKTLEPYVPNLALV